jgi:hypothetical protein
MKALLYTQDGETRSVQLDTFSDAQDYIGGLVQILPKDRSNLFVFNEEGRVLGLPKNKTFEQFVGNVIVVDTAEFDKLPFGG